MKNTIAIIATMLITLSASAQWNRINVGVDYAWQQTTLKFDGGLLYGRPDRAAHLNLGYRLWQHWEVGLYLGVQGASYSSSNTSSYNTAQGDPYTVTSFRDEQEWNLTTGVMVQYHILSFNKRNEWRLDGVVRLGFTPGGAEIDNFWGGLGMLYRLSEHTSLLINADMGTFRTGRLINRFLENGATPVRYTAGVQVAL